MNEPLLVGLDVGTTSIKAVAFDASGKPVSSAAVQTPTQTPRADWASHNPEALWEAAASALKQMSGGLPEPGSIRGVAVASMAEAGVLVDGGGAAVSEMIAWYCTRTLDILDRVIRPLDSDSIFRLTGLPPRPIYSLLKILWLKEHEPERFKQAAAWLNVADYIAFRLSGEQATDYSLASRTMAFDVTKREWAEDLLTGIGISHYLFADPVPSGTAIGKVTEPASTLTGLPTSAVVSTGGHDHVCGALAADVIRPGEALNSLGTAEALFLPTRKAPTTPALGRQGYTTGAHVYPDTSYVLGGIYTSGGSVEWFRSVLSGDDAQCGVPELEVLIGEAADAPMGSLGVRFLPHLRLAAAPHGNDRSRGGFIGISPSAGRGVMFRAILEGLAFESRQVMEGMKAVKEVPSVRRLTAIGGGARNGLLMDIKAAVLNRPIDLIETEEASAMGAAILGGVGAGVFKDIDAGIRAFLPGRRTISPSPEQVVFYAEAYEHYRKLYPVLHHLHQEMELMGE